MLSLTLYTVTDIKELNVLLKDGSRTTTLWWQSGNHGDLWQHGEVTVGRTPQDFTILFEASRTFNKPGHIAIDDIDFTNCTLPGRLCYPALPAHVFFKLIYIHKHYLWCVFSEPQPVCPENMFMCNNSVCVESNQVCDFSDDCGDWSDENICGELNIQW